MVLTRPDDMRFDSFRSPSIQNAPHGNSTPAASHSDGASRVRRLAHRSRGPDFMAKGLNDKRYDQFAISGADHCTMLVRSACARCRTTSQSGFPARLSALGGVRLDQLGGRDIHGRAAHAARTDPVAFRLGLLDGAGRMPARPNSVGGAKRQAAVLRRAAEKRLGTVMPRIQPWHCDDIWPGTHDADVGRLCCTVRVDRGRGAVLVDKLTIVWMRHLGASDGALAQIQGALLGLSMALHEGTEFVRGQVKIQTSTLIRRCGSATCLSLKSSSLTVQKPQSPREPHDRRGARHRHAVFAASGFGFATCPSGQTPYSGHSRAKVECNDVLGVMWRECTRRCNLDRDRFGHGGTDSGMLTFRIGTGP